MLLHKRDLDKVRCGTFKCPTCGNYYDPTYGPCPQCSRKYNIATIAFAVVVLLFLLFWLPLEGAAKAQEVPPETPQISATWWVPTLTPFEPTDTPEPVPTPTVTRRPTPTPTQIVISPLPQHYVWLPVAAK